MDMEESPQLSKAELEEVSVPVIGTVERTAARAGMRSTGRSTVGTVSTKTHAFNVHECKTVEMTRNYKKA